MAGEGARSGASKMDLEVVNCEFLTQMPAHTCAGAKGSSEKCYAAGISHFPFPTSPSGMSPTDERRVCGLDKVPTAAKGASVWFLIRSALEAVLNQC